MDAIIIPKSAPVAFHRFRTITYAVIEANRIVSTVEVTVITAELPNALQKFIFFMASGKFPRVNPWAPTKARGFDVISAVTLKTLITTKINGKIKQRNSRIKMSIFIKCRTFLF